MTVYYYFLSIVLLLLNTNIADEGWRSNVGYVSATFTDLVPTLRTVSSRVEEPTKTPLTGAASGGRS